MHAAKLAPFHRTCCKVNKSRPCPNLTVSTWTPDSISIRYPTIHQRQEAWSYFVPPCLHPPQNWLDHHRHHHLPWISRQVGLPCESRMCDCCFRKLPNKSIGNTIGFKNQLAEIKLERRKWGMATSDYFCTAAGYFIPIRSSVSIQSLLGGLRISKRAFIRTPKSIGNTIGFNSAS